MDAWSAVQPVAFDPAPWVEHDDNDSRIPGLVMQFSLMLYQTDDQFAARTDPARRDAVAGAFMRYVRALQEAGVLITTLGIEPPETAATVRPVDGAPRVQDGPYADTTEQLGGLCVIEVPDHDAALAWARRAPFEHCGVVEVRPTRVVPPA